MERIPGRGSSKGEGHDRYETDECEEQIRGCLAVPE